MINMKKKIIYALLLLLLLTGCTDNNKSELNNDNNQDVIEENNDKPIEYTQFTALDKVYEENKNITLSFWTYIWWCRTNVI